MIRGAPADLRFVDVAAARAARTQAQIAATAIVVERHEAGRRGPSRIGGTS